MEITIQDHDGCQRLNVSNRNKIAQLEYSKKKNRNKAELVAAKKEHIVGYDVAPGTRINAVRYKCMKTSVPLKPSSKSIILEGWCGKAKRIMQVLWKRGFIDYTLSGSKDKFGIIDTNTSLKYLLENLTDFVEEESLLQSNVRKMGVQLNCTPNYHTELAGEDIEYTWSFGKKHF